MYTSSELLDKVNVYLRNLSLPKQPAGLYEPISYELMLGGKRIRPVLMLMAYNLYRNDVDAILNQAAGIETYHNYTLLHDDLMDRADKRRGKPTVHKVWNDNVAILSGDAMLVLAYKLMSACDVSVLSDALETFSQTAMEVCEGQQYDMDFETRNDVTEEEYIEMIRLKTSVLLAASLKIGALLAGAPAPDVDRLYEFGLNLGLAFQLKDDLLDVYGDPATFGKSIGGDILCNKKTYMLIQAQAHAEEPQLAELNAWLAKADFDPVEKIAAVTAIYNKVGVRQMCEERIAFYTRKAESALDEVSVPKESKVQLSALLNKLMFRQA